MNTNSICPFIANNQKELMQNEQAINQTPIKTSIKIRAV